MELGGWGNGWNKDGLGREELERAAPILALSMFPSDDAKEGRAKLGESMLRPAGPMELHRLT